MHKFYIHSPNFSGDKIIVSNKIQIHHIKDVLRLKLKEEVVLFDREDNEYSGIVDKLLPKSIAFKIKDKRKFIHPQGIKITFACAIPKGLRMDNIVDGLTQLGVERIIPLITERVIVKWDEKQKAAHLRRWAKISLYAAQQSQRNTLPIIEPIKAIKEVLVELKRYDLKLIPTLDGERKQFKDILNASKPNNLLVLIGPEGDFTPQEIIFAKQLGCIPVSLGDLVLRVETAAIAAASFIRLYAGG